MNSGKLYNRAGVLFLAFGIITYSVLAIMPPEVYRKAIKNSPIKAVAIVTDVEVVEEADTYIRKKIEFELVESYGAITPPKTFYGYCKSATENKIVGGTIYYYPVAAQEVFVTLGSVNEGGDTGTVTSYTLMDESIRRVLKEKGFDGLKYCMGSVSAE